MNPDDPQGHAAAPRPWKGLRTDRMPVFIGYDQVERMVAALLEPRRRGGRTRWSPSCAAAWCRPPWRRACWRCLCRLSVTRRRPER